MNFLQRAVAGVESRLDQVLASDPNLMDGSLSSPSPTTASGTTPPSTVSPQTTVAKDARPTPPTSTSSTPTPMSGRMTMQERLAMAMARGANARSASPALGKPDRAMSPSPSITAREEAAEEANVEPRQSEDTKAEENERVEVSATVQEDVKAETKTEEIEEITELEAPRTNGVSSPEPKPANQTPRASVDIPRKSLESQLRISFEAKSQPMIDINKTPATAAPTGTATPDPITSTELVKPTSSAEDLEAIISQLREDLAVCESRRAEESAAASERIDSLEEKLKFLSKEAADEARKRILTGGTSALEKELAKRDERIALLLEEGERLSKIELKHMNNIKRLRAKTQEEEKATAEAKRKQEKAEREAADLRDKMKRAVEAEKRANERVKSLGKMEVDYESMKRERDILQISTSDLKLQLAKAVARADEAESKVQTEALEAERRITADLREKLERAQNDAIADKERHKSEVWTLQSKLERDGDRAKAMELELKNEISMLETKLEILRSRAEEASTGSSGHTHAKMLRQIETLQSQYAVASENWQGIEASLMSRLTSVEKERDELSRKESDVRRKAREVNQKLKRLESDLESANLKVQDLESSLNTQLLLCEDLRKQVTLHEESKAQTNKKFDEERAAWQKEIKDLRESLNAANEDFSRPKSRSNSALDVEGAIRPISPNPRPRKPSIGSDMNVPFASKRILSRSGSKERLNELHAQRRPTLPGYTSSHASTPRLDSISGFSGGPTSARNSMFGSFSGLGMGVPVNMPSTPSLNTTMQIGGDGDNESIFDGNGVQSPGSHEGRNGAHIGDMLSVSTVAAGPSVQLVERMSAAVRRLESEMATSREELARMTAQRDEARAEVVGFMTEVDEKRSLESRVNTLETELREKEALHEATLVMLGEKSEEVEELRNDVSDLKQMYRDLIMSQTK
ncbi:hypothetical protein ABW19_dt0202846 [Dactylella cylindrospora]|nr:hypothetical protein ABW19_dt0202846 [Dactylella cylindrospora]